MRLKDWLLAQRVWLRAAPPALTAYSELVALLLAGAVELEGAGEAAVHVVPLPVKPSLHLHSTRPSARSRHVALASHGGGTEEQLRAGLQPTRASPRKPGLQRHLNRPGPGLKQMALAAQGLSTHGSDLRHFVPSP